MAPPTMGPAQFPSAHAPSLGRPNEVSTTYEYLRAGLSHYAVPLRSVEKGYEVGVDDETQHDDAGAADTLECATSKHLCNGVR